MSSTQLDGLQELIFLDRYALKDVDGKNLNENDVVVALVEDHPVFPRREVGRVKAKNGVGVDVELKQTGDVISLETYRVDKPLELYPEQMWERVASAMVEVEPEEERDRVKSDFLWALRDFRFVPGGRIMTAAGTNHGKTMYNCVQGDTLVHTVDGTVKIRDLQGKSVRVLSKDGVVREAKFRSFGKQNLLSVVLDNGCIVEATAGHDWFVTKSKGGLEKVKTVDLVGRRIPVIKGFRPFKNDDFFEGVRHGIVFGDGTNSVSQNAQEYGRVLLFGESEELVRFFEGDKRFTITPHVGGKYLGVYGSPVEWKELPADGESPSYWYGFICGLIAADGYCDDRGSSGITQADLSVLERIRDKLSVVGITPAGIGVLRTESPFTGEEAPCYVLRFVKQTMDEKDFIRKSHSKRFLESLSERSRQGTVGVVAVIDSGKEEEVFCAIEPETNSFVIAEGYLTGNCYVLPSPRDSRRGILKSAGDMIEVMAKGGGVGMTISSLRPRSARVYGVNGRSNGSVAWGELYSMVTILVNQDGGRRGALMLTMNDWHPDLMEFIRDKKKPGRKEGCNMSVLVSDRFMRALKNDELWTFVFPDYEKAGMDVYDEEWDGCLETWVAKGHPVKTYGRLPAREIWDEIMQSAWESGEPGVIFIERANKMANSYYYAQIVGSNPCGEQMLPPNGVCCLGSIVLPRFVDERGVRWDELRRAVHTAVRFLDNVIDTTPHVFDEIREWQAAERRIGLGTMGLGEMLLTMKLRYGSPESLEFVDELYKFIAVEAYRASVHLAIEKGPFPRFDRDAFLASGFMKKMPEEIRRMVWKHGIRNVALLTQAPTGSIGTMVGTSTGIEPFYSWEYFRKGRFGKFREEVAPVKEWRRQNPGASLPEYFVTAMDLTPEEHMAVQAAVQRWVDASISKTVNAPSWFSVEDTKKAYEQAYELGCKGLTVYRDGSREEQVLSIEEMEEEEGELKEVASSCGLVIGPNGVEKTCSL